MPDLARNTAATGLCIPDLEQHHGSSRTVYGSFRSEGSRCGGTPLLRDDCVRVNSFGTGSQHIPDLEQHPYHMLGNTLVRFDYPELKQHRCYGTVYGLIRFIMYYYDFCFFSALPSSFSTWNRLHLTLCTAFIPQKMYYKPNIYFEVLMTLMCIFLSGVWVAAKPAPMQSPCKDCNIAAVVIIGLFGGQVKPHRSGRARSGHLPRPDPRKF